MTSAKFIAFEGGEGAGKSTQAKMLADALTNRGLTVELTREPGGTPGAELIRDLLLSKEGDGWTPQAEALLFAAARAEHVVRRIRPALAKGRWIVSDRFVDSSRAYQAVGSGLSDEDIVELHRIGSGGILPDLTILLTLPNPIASDRASVRDGSRSDRIGGRDAHYHAMVARTFAAIADRESDRMVAIDGNGDRATVHARIIDAVGTLLL